MVPYRLCAPGAGGAYLIAKMVMGMVFAAAAMLLLVVAALVAGKISLTAPQLAIMAVVMIVSSIPFAALGLFIGAYTSGAAAPAFTNMLFFPMLWLSGLFIPLPKFLESWAVIWPAFHLNQVALGLTGISEFSIVAAVNLPRPSRRRDRDLRRSGDPAPGAARLDRPRWVPSSSGHKAAR